MRAALCRAYGPPESLEIGELEPEPLGDDGIRVAVHAAAANFPDTLIIQGKYQVQPRMPFAPGFEIAGEVIEVAPGVDGFRPGDRVMGLTRAGYGAYAEEAVTCPALAALVPGAMDFVTATAFFSSYGTAYHALVQRGRLRADETLVVLGAAGGVGLPAIEIAKALGSRVIAVASSPAKTLAATAHGADAVIESGSELLKERVRELTDGRGADVCVDLVGGDAFDVMARSMAPEGRLLVVGFASGRIPELPANLPLLKGYSLVGVWWHRFLLRDPETAARNTTHLAELYAAGRLSPVVHRVFPLEHLATALNEILSRRAIGRVVVSVR